MNYFNKKFFLVLVLLIICSISSIYKCVAEPIPPGQYPGIKDTKIIKALDCLQGTDGEWARRAISGYNASKSPIKVLFKDLSTINKEFSNLDALGWQDEQGKLLIFINKKHNDAPPEALGALLSHESIHQDRYNSIKEETYGWTYEAEVWIQLKEKYPHLKNIAPGENSLVDRENMMEMLFRKGNFTPKLIEQKVRSNPSYKSLPETSPGFGM
jgi:hypothetical protein